MSLWVYLEHGDDYAYEANITHNLARMAGEAGIHKYVWLPDKNGITRASQLIEPLEAGLTLLKLDPERFKALNPDNGWGDYGALVGFVANYLEACKEYPETVVRASR